MPVSLAPYDQERHAAPDFYHLGLNDVMVPLKCCKHHVTLTLIPMALCDTNISGMIGCQWQWQLCNMTKKVLLLLISCLDVRSVVLPLTMLIASCDANISANGMTWPEKSCCTSLQSSWPNKCNGAIDNAINTTCCLCQYQWQHITKRFMLHLISIILT